MLNWLKAQFARKQDCLTRSDLFALRELLLSGLARLVALLFWGFPQLLGNLRSIPAALSLFVGNIWSLGTPAFVLAGIIVTVWILTQDSTFTQR